MKIRVFIFLLVQVFLFSDKSFAVMTCYKDMNILLRNVQPPEKNITLSLDKPLKYDADELENWVIGHKAQFEDYLKRDNREFAVHLVRSRNMDLHERKALSFFVDIRPIEEESNVYVALFWSAENLNRAQMRTKFYNVGGNGATAGIIPSERSVDLHRRCETCRGMRLTGNQYRKFWDEITRDYNHELYPEEHAFYRHAITPLMEKHPTGNFHVISISAKSFSMDTLVQETHHTRFITNPDYRETLEKYWKNNIKENEVKEINSLLPTYHRLEELILEDFFGLIFQPKVFGQVNPLEKYKKEHLNAVIKELEEVGLTIPFQ